MKKIQTLIPVLFLISTIAFGQFNPAKPDLCQGSFYTEAQAVTVHQEFAKLYSDKSAWAQRAALIKKGILDGAGIANLNYDKPKHIVIHSKKILNGYSVENVSFESSVKGIYVTGNLYTPLSISGKTAAILCPHGHGADPRYKEYTQQRCATLARMGAVVFAYDMLGQGDAKYCDHKIEGVLKLQLLNGIQIVNFLTSLPYVDKNRIGMTGESGGGTQTFVLSAVDDRIKVSVPVVMVSGYFFGGCLCESGMPIHKRPTHQTTNVEIAACFAPKPLLLVSDGGDWTKNNPVMEYPHIKRIYGFYNAGNNVENAHFATEKHDYGISKRLAAYPFLAKHLGLDIQKVMKNGAIDETANTILTEADLKVFTKEYPMPQDALQGNTAVSLAINPTTSSQIQPTKLTCEYIANPLGIDVKTPRLSWNFTATERNQIQSAYELIVSDNLKDMGQGKGNMWQTGKVNTAQNLHIQYIGSELLPFTKYYWRVKAYDKKDIASTWSNIATFETAAFQASDWQAQWISDGSKQFERDEDFYQNDPMPLFKKQFKSAKTIASARLYISGLGYYEAYLNDKKIGDNVLDPGFTAYRKQVLYTTYDITDLLQKDNNTLGIMLGNGWYNPLPLRLFGRFNLRDFQQTGRPIVKAQILMRYSDGSSETIATDNTWQTASGAIIRNNIYLGETYDARLEKPFSSQAGWKNAVVAESPSGVLTAQLLPPIRITKIVKPIAIKEVGKDTFIVDMGQNFAGVARIKVKGVAGQKISLRYGELIYPDGRLNFWTSVAGQIKEPWNLKGGAGAPKTALQQDDYILKGIGEEVWQPRFTFHSFRYVQITGWRGKPTLNDIEGLRMNTDIAQNGNFSCSNDMFNRLHEVIQWTFLSNIFSVQSDCPAREKFGYGADIVATTEAYMYNYNMAHFYTKAVQDFANDQQPDGGITETAPFVGIADRGYGGNSGPLGWQLAFPFLQKKLYDYYGDKRIIEQQYPAVKKQMDFLQTKAIQGLFHWDISDHEALDPRPEAFTAAAFYYHHAVLAAEFATILGNKTDSISYSKLADKIKKAIVSKYYVPKTGRFDNATQAAQTFALWYGLSPEKDAILKVLMDEYTRHNDHVSGGIFCTKMMFDVLRENDKNDVAYKIANQRDFPSWGYMLAQGATTLWETWAASDNVYSQNHPMFGSIDEWFYKSLLGINAGAAGFSKIIIKPQPAELTWAKGSYESVHGTITSDWKKEGNSFTLKVAIPVNTTAEIWIPSKENALITEGGGKNIELLKEIRVLRYEKGYTVLAVGSGEYIFQTN
jgi:alpha-L-rhamnosidase